LQGFFYQNLGSLSPLAVGPGGTIKLWNIDNPALYGQGASQALVEFEPCGLNLPHVHPRGLEFIHVLYGNIVR
jgi:quercetin dioxygenase-like cupin family protein